MLTFMVFWKHAASDCPTGNEKFRKTMFEMASKQGELAAKHGVKQVGFWNIHAEHTVVEVYEVPNYEALNAYLMEPEPMNMLDFNTMEIKRTSSLDETSEFIQKKMMHA